MTPKKLAAELGISPKTLRAFLRDKYPRETKGPAWVITPGMAERARGRFG